MAVDNKRETALAARRAREKKVRDSLDESYIKRLIRKRYPELGPDAPIHPGYITIRKFSLAIRRMFWGRWTPEMDEAYQAFSEEYKRKMSEKEKQKR